MSRKGHVVIVEDDDGNRESYLRALKREYRVQGFTWAEPALEYLRQHSDVDLVITDLHLPEIDGLGVVEEARKIKPGVGILMITGHASVETAVLAMKMGANDYLKKPVELGDLRDKVAKIVGEMVASPEQPRVDSADRFGRLIGASAVMRALYAQIELVGPTRSSVLIVGESGTGKELVAQAIHETSPRGKARFLPINCAAIPSDILESELFGHERGAFTGAHSRKIGKFELADGGTLFLDEIGELPLEMQVKLLRVLEQREFMRVGGTETIRVDLRLIAATNADLEVAVEQGKFRSDLYYRLKVVTLRIPTLRERTDDIPLLANHFLQTIAKENGREGMRFAPDAMDVLVSAAWDGNVRELRNLVESLVVLSPSTEIAAAELPPEIRTPAASAPEPVATAPAVSSATGGEVPVGMTMDEIEKRAILRALDETKGNRTQAAEMLGIGLRTLQRKLKEYRLAEKEE